MGPISVGWVPDSITDYNLVDPAMQRVIAPES